MKVRYLAESALYSISESFDTYLPLFAEETNKPLVDKLKEVLETDTIFRDTKYTFPDEPLSPSKASEDEMNSIIAVFGSMKDLPNAVAMDERLWAGIAIDLCWSYVRERWDIAALFAGNVDCAAVTAEKEAVFHMKCGFTFREPLVRERR